VSRLFLLSPADCRGLRARRLLAGRGDFELARRLRESGGAPIGEVFRFLSGLYFRGKLAYARAFAAPPEGMLGVFVIAPGTGLLEADAGIKIEDLARFASCRMEQTAASLARDAARLAEEAGEECDIVLLGSIATGKYVDPLLLVFGDRLLFPSAFVGRGDMSRGGLMLRAAASGKELDYVSVRGASRRGRRPPRLGRPVRRHASPRADRTPS
jgi:hypothetical protein